MLIEARLSKGKLFPTLHLYNCFCNDTHGGQTVRGKTVPYGVTVKLLFVPWVPVVYLCVNFNSVYSQQDVLKGEVGNAILNTKSKTGFLLFSVCNKYTGVNGLL